jgi:hypothetical protein
METNESAMINIEPMATVTTIINDYDGWGTLYRAPTAKST